MKNETTRLVGDCAARWCRIREAKCLKKLLLGHSIAIDDGDDDDEEEEVVVVAAVVVVAIILSSSIIQHYKMITNNSTSELDKNPSHPDPSIPSQKRIKRQALLFRAILTVRFSAWL